MCFWILHQKSPRLWGLDGYFPVSFHRILVKDVTACQCLPFSSIFCCPLLAPRLFQEGEESFPTMPLREYLQKEIVFGLFTPLDIYNQNRKLLLKHFIAWQTSGDLHGYNRYTILLVYLFVHVTTVCSKRSQTHNVCLLIRSAINCPSPIQAQCQA